MGTRTGSIEHVFELGNPAGDPVGPVLLDWQPNLFADSPALDLRFSTLRRYWLDQTSWVDHAPGWLSGGDELFGELLEQGEWRQRVVTMWDNVVLEPRLTMRWPDRDWPEILEQARAALETRYQKPYASVSVNLYRDGRDSVAWHRDRIHHSLETPQVATISLGATRTFRLRPFNHDRGKPLTLTPANGDLIVMGGRCQQDWEHIVPKCAAALPRMAVTVRHSADTIDGAAPSVNRVRQS